MTGKHSNQDFLKIYMNTLEELRQNGRIFSQQNPELAPYLDFSYRKSNDPETERLIESFAYMKAQIEHKSFLVQSDYAISFIDHIFPELVSPIPALTVIQVEPSKNYFKKGKTQFKIDRNTKFSSKNSEDDECLFSTTHDAHISCCEIKNYRFVDVNSSKEDIFGHKKAFVFDLETLIPIEEFHKIDLSIFIDAEFHSVISIFDTLLHSKLPILIFKDDEAVPIKLSRDCLKPIYYFKSHYDQSEENLLHPLFDFINFYQKYFFFKIQINTPLSVTKKLKFVIPVDEEVSTVFKIGSSFFKLNCVPIVNIFEKKMVPIKCTKDIHEYHMRVDNNKQNQIEVLKVTSLTIYDSASGNAVTIPNFHKKNNGLSNFSTHFVWSTKRVFSKTTRENGCLYLKLLNKNKENENEINWPDYIFPAGLCTNGNLVDGIKPNSLFSCLSYDLPIEKSFSIIWPKFSQKPLNLYENSEVIKLLYKANQDLLTRNALNNYDLGSIIEYLSSGQSPIKTLFKQIITYSSGFSVEETLSQQVWKNQSYHVPGILYKFHFSKVSGFPLGTHFLISFLNAYFNYIRDFNFYIEFEAEMK